MAPPSIEDPFHAARKETNVTTVVHFDQFAEANERVEAFEKIRETYLEHAPEDSLPLLDLLHNWIAKLSVALCQDPFFIRLICDEFLFPSTASSERYTKFQTKEEWAIGVYLPGSYHVYSSWEALFKVIQENETGIIKGAAQRLREALQEVHSSLLGAQRTDQSEESSQLELYGAWAFDNIRATPHPSTIALVQLVNTEKTEYSCRNALATTLKGLTPLVPEIANPAKTIKAARDVSAGHPHIDVFGAKLLKELWQTKRTLTTTFKPLPELSDAEMKNLRRITDKNILQQAADQESADTTPQAETVPTTFWGDKGGIPVQHLQSDNDLPPHYHILATKAHNWLQGPNGAVFYPTFVTPKSGALVDKALMHDIYGSSDDESESTPKPEEKKSISFADKISAATGYRTKGMSSTKIARLRSLQELEEQVLRDPIEIVSLAFGDARKSMSYNPNDWNQNSGFDDKIFQAIYTRLTSLTERSDEAKIMKTDKQITNVLFYDNIFHVRKFLAALRTFLASNKAVVELLVVLERRLLMVLAAVRGAASDVLSFVVASDHILRRIAIAVHDSLPTMKKMETWTDNDTVTVNDVVDELVLFTHGAVIVGVVLRFESKEDNRFLSSGMARVTGQQIGDWYKMYFTAEPRCGNPECRRLLPDPEQHSAIEACRKVFSIGTRDARVGKKATRAFVSKNHFTSKT